MIESDVSIFLHKIICCGYLHILFYGELAVNKVRNQQNYNLIYCESVQVMFFTRMNYKKTFANAKDKCTDNTVLIHCTPRIQ